MTISYRPPRTPAQRSNGRPEQVASDLKRYRHEAGLEEFQVNFNGCGSLQQLLDSMDVLAQDVMPLVED